MAWFLPLHTKPSLTQAFAFRRRSGREPPRGGSGGRPRLADHGQGGGVEVLRGVLVDRHAVQADAARRRVVQAEDEVDHRRLPPAARPHQRHRLPRLDGQAARRGSGPCVRVIAVAGVAGCRQMYIRAEVEIESRNGGCIDGRNSLSGCLACSDISGARQSGLK